MGQRWAATSGVLFAASFVTLFVVFFVPGEQTAGAPGTQIAQYYRDRGPAGLLLMYALFGIAGVALMWFSASLSASLRQVERGAESLAVAAFGGGVASATLLLVGGAMLLAPFTIVIVHGAQTIDPTLHEALSTIAFTAVNLGLLGSSLMVVATSLITMRERRYPRWFAWLGFAVAVALSLNILYFFGLFIWVGWVLLASILVPVRGAHGAALEVRDEAAASAPLAIDPRG
jgi:hypothetical protein